MDAKTILEAANLYMESCLESSQKTAANCQALNKETALNIIQNCKSAATGVYSFAHSLIYRGGNEEDTMPILNELEALYCDTYKQAFDKLFQEVKAK